MVVRLFVRQLPGGLLIAGAEFIADFFKKSYLLDVGEHTESAWFPAVFP